MTGKSFNQQDREQIKSLHLTLDQVKDQIKLFEKGTAHATLVRPATIDDGIKSFSYREKQQLARRFDSLPDHNRMIKFIPSSGAATRMFQIPLNFYNNPEKIDRWPDREKNDSKEEYDFLREFLLGLGEKKFAFYHDLQSVLTKKKLDLDVLINQGKIKTILKYLLTGSGLNYANLPKALLKFHQYPDHSRTPFEEHLVETARYLKNSSEKVWLHFTLSPEFRHGFRIHRDSSLKRYEKSGTRYEISFSTQPPHTNTIAVDLYNQPLRNSQGGLVFRPGGHGALIENLNNLTEEFVFITNIDNVAPDHLKSEVVFHKKVLGGYLGITQEKIFKYLDVLSGGELQQNKIEEIRTFCEQELMLVLPEQFQKRGPEERRKTLFDLLNRPIRVCGMVENLGEPGGGPFWIKDKKDRVSLQIIEATQVKEIESQTTILSQSSHFNPVDLVCGIKNFKGEKFNLLDFVDPDSYFISEKSLKARPLKALELPGLWNGAMAKWITVFVDVPVHTFFPVKNVNDLLRKQHQPENISRIRRRTL